MHSRYSIFETYDITMNSITKYIEVIAMGPVACITTSYCGRAAKTITFTTMVINTYSPCHRDACVQISIGNTEWLLCYKGVSQTCFSSEKACFRREFWLGETPPGPSSRPRILVASGHLRPLSMVSTLCGF